MEEEFSASLSIIYNWRQDLLRPEDDWKKCVDYKKGGKRVWYYNKGM